MWAGENELLLPAWLMGSGWLTAKLCSRSIARDECQAISSLLHLSFVSASQQTKIMSPRKGLQPESKIGAACADVWKSNAELGMCSISTSDVKDGLPKLAGSKISRCLRVKCKVHNARHTEACSNTGTVGLHELAPPGCRIRQQALQMTAHDRTSGMACAWQMTCIGGMLEWVVSFKHCWTCDGLKHRLVLWNALPACKHPT